MKLIFCLGNPEAKYEGTRHNLGFMVADKLADTHQSPWKRDNKFRADYMQVVIGGEKTLVAKPATYYNLVGESLRSICGYYNIDPSKVLIVHDDLALDFGTIRTRAGGSGGGSNGIKSVNAHGGESTMRLRIGVRNELADRIDNADFVLSRFSKQESNQLPDIIDRAVLLVDDFVSGNLEATTYTAIAD